jgi:hypothetical protein
MNPETMAEAYLRRRDEDFWAWEEVHRVVETDLKEGWEITLLLLERAASDGDVGYIAAGPLEDLIDLHGHEALDLIEEGCKSNARLRLALSTVAVMFYYAEFERWYDLLYRYGFRRDRVANSTIIGNVMGVMKLYVSESIGVYDYADRVTGMLDKPFEDKPAQRILQKMCEAVEILDSKQPPDYREPRLTRTELKERVTEALAKLECLGYQANSSC